MGALQSLAMAHMGSKVLQQAWGFADVIPRLCTLVKSARLPLRSLAAGALSNFALGSPEGTVSAAAPFLILSPSRTAMSMTTPLLGSAAAKVWCLRMPFCHGKAILLCLMSWHQVVAAMKTNMPCASRCVHLNPLCTQMCVCAGGHAQQ